MAHFGKALKDLRDGQAWHRNSWANGVFVRCYQNEALLMRGRSGWGVWKPKVEDLLAYDWQEYKPLGSTQGKLQLGGESADSLPPSEKTPMPDDLREQSKELKNKKTRAPISDDEFNMHMRQHGV